MKSSASFPATTIAKTGNNNNIEKDSKLTQLELNLKVEDSPDEAAPIYFYKRLKPEQEELINRLVRVIYLAEAALKIKHQNSTTPTTVYKFLSSYFGNAKKIVWLMTHIDSNLGLNNHTKNKINFNLRPL